MKSLTRTLSAFAVTSAALAITMLPAQAVDIQTVKSSQGITALLVEDYTVPVIALQFGFHGGSTQDANGKEGTAHLMTTLLDEGAGDIESRAFQEKLDDVGVSYTFNAGFDSFSGGIKTLRTGFDEGTDLLAMMLNKPRFDADPIERMKTSLSANIRRAEKNPQTLASKAISEATFGDHPYGRPKNGTVESIASITAQDLESYRSSVFTRDNIVIGVVGAISAEELKPILDKVFATLPAKANLKTIPEAKIETGKKIHVDLAVPQTNIGFVLPGVKRKDKDFFAAYLVNHVLGGGSFSSRLFTEVREKRGLAYGAYSYLATRDHSGSWSASSATSAGKAKQTVDIMRAEFKRMGEEGPSAKELEDARKFITGTYAISNLDSSDKIASVLVAIQQGDLGIDYIDKRAEYLAAVTLEDTKRVAKELLTKEPTQVTVGKKLSE